MSKPSKQQVILGIDPGFDKVGWAIGGWLSTSGITPTNYGLLKTCPQDQPLVRLNQVRTELDQLLVEYQPGLAIIESLFLSTNQKTAMMVAQARGIILATLFEAGIDVVEQTPLQLKLAVTGYGHADKAAMKKMVRLQFPAVPDQTADDTIDAIGLLLTYQPQQRMK